MNCEDLRDDYELYALGLLEGDQKAEIDAHLGRDCSTCRNYLKDALATNSKLLSIVPEVAPPARLKRRVLASSGVPRRGWGWAAALAAACMLLVALWLSIQQRRLSDDLGIARQAILRVSAQRDSLQQALSFLNDPETIPVSFGKGQPAPPRGHVLVNPRNGVLLIVSNLPQLTAGKIYEMWVIPKGGAPRPAGLFQSTPAGDTFHILSGQVDPATLGAVAVTVEPESGSSAPTTKPIIVAPVAGL